MTQNSDIEFKPLVSPVPQLLERNKEWSTRMSSVDPELFVRNGKGQSPEYLWIGCSDSRISEAVIDMLPGSVFVHRNVANQIPAGDLSSISVVHFAVEVLKVKHIIICGHYDCGGIIATLGNKSLGILDHWLKHLRDIRVKHHEEIDALQDQKARIGKLVELNIIAQVHNVCRMAPVASGLAAGTLTVSGMVYDCSSGLLHPVEIPKDDNKLHYILEQTSDLGSAH
ncbi:carbonic anhydrase [Dipodascopsis uninucleata]